MGKSVKKQKSIKKTLYGYCFTFGFRVPYQVIVDGDFCRAALEKKIYVKDELPDLLGGLTRIVVTNCILNDIKSRGHDYTNSFVLAKKFEMRKCIHHKLKNPVSAQQCIRDLISTNNPEHFFVGTGDAQLKNFIRSIPGVPVVIVNTRKKGLGLEDMTFLTKKRMQEIEINKAAPLERETVQLKRALQDNEKIDEKPKKKRKVKGINPLSMKKKKKAFPQNKNNENKKSSS